MVANAQPARRRRAFRLAAMICGLGAAALLLGAVEGICRRRWPRQRGNMIPHPVLNHALRPSSEFEHHQWVNNGMPPYRHVYNSRGWIGAQEVEQVKPPGEFRIFYVGDSFTEGTCPMPASLPSQVAQRLQPRFAAAGLKLRLINAGVNSYSPMIYYLWIRDYILPFDPDLIVVNVDVTDVFDDFLYRNIAVYDAAGELQACPPATPLAQQYERTVQGLRRRSTGQRWLEWLRQSRVAELALTALQPRQQTDEVQPQPDADLPGLFDWCAETWTPQTTVLVEQSLGILVKLAELVKQHDVGLVLTLVPHKQHFLPPGHEYAFSHRAFKVMRALCQQQGVAYLDSFGGFRQRMTGSELDYYLYLDMHFNVRGYALWAEVQADFLLDPKNGLLPPQVLADGQ